MKEFSCENFSLTYVSKRGKEKTEALKNITFSVPEGSFNVILGPSGAGKTSLLKAIAGLYPFEGDIKYGGKPLKEWDPILLPRSYVSQEYVLYPRMTVFDNIAFPLKASGAGKKEIVESVKEITDFLDLTYLWGRKPKELSGGQCQKVALAKAMVKRPAIALFDEPLSNIDQQARFEEKEYIKESCARARSTVFYVTHSLKEALSLAENFIILKNGSLLAFGSKDSLMKSTNIEVRSMLNVSEYAL
jgi:ABC-type sugar transport system ATPase subunit